MPRILAVGDIHGRYNEFISLLSYINFDIEEDFLIATGDLIDRGPDSYKVVKWFKDMNYSTNGRVQSVFGNHEHIFISYFSGHVPEKDYFNKFIGGKATIDSYKRDVNSEDEFAEHLSFIGSLPLTVQIGKYVFAHAGININKSLKNQNVNDTAWDYTKTYKQDTSSFDGVLIYGHTPTVYIYEHYSEKGHEVWRRGNQICIDCSFSKSRKLCILDVINDIEYYYDFSKKSCYKKKN